MLFFACFYILAPRMLGGRIFTSRSFHSQKYARTYCVWQLAQLAFNDINILRRARILIWNFDLVRASLSTTFLVKMEHLRRRDLSILRNTVLFVCAGRFCSRMYLHIPSIILTEYVFLTVLWAPAIIYIGRSDLIACVIVNNKKMRLFLAIFVSSFVLLCLVTSIITDKN